MRSVHVVVPEAVDDAARPSGGNTYDRRVCAELARLGWTVHLHPVSGGWPHPEAPERAALDHLLAGLPDGAPVLLDGLVACCSAGVARAASRMRVAVLVHLPLDATPDRPVDPGRGATEQEVLSAAGAVVTASDWARRWVIGRYALDETRVHVVAPGVDRADLAPTAASGGRLLCVAAVVPAKGHDLVVEALAQLGELSWGCTFVGALDLDPAFVDDLVRRCDEAGISDRVALLGPVGAAELAEVYAASDLLVLASRLETYGLVVTEALARGLPVVASSVGGIPEAMGRAPDGTLPGLLVPGGDARALAAALRGWLGDSVLRERLRGAARHRRSTLAPWSQTARRLSKVLGGLGEPGGTR